ncbi:MAG: tRNA (N6-threonylcarbamoyladenosine(37)-N6)-methyltransferase TrmO [Bacteroidales bacterium]|nr:tRNA (N6-threonylcarbamoyladenosine(37)-N6)-methyltransferase TrmO [Bacteroidales bacterium]MBN2758423.1 tRNA (N6-threonylcarbamoyladenosine(37)-N6)-methyltransferase TrmO [Bacteroidales bacterium]
MIKIKVFIFVIVLFTITCKNKTQLTYNPIGYFSSQYNLETGAPRQGALVPDSKGIIILDEKYMKALNSLNQFEYIWVLFHFHEAKGYENIVKPPESNHEFGLFATRSPRRPNPIGLSLIKLDSIVKNKLYVSGIDIFDKTPVLDIKPFLPSVDCMITEKNMIAEYYLGHHTENYINDSLVKIFIEGEKK